MLATTTVLCYPSPLPTARSCLLSSSRSALADSTNIIPRSDVCGLGPKGFAYPTSSVRTSCRCSETSDSSSASVSTPFQSRHHHLSSTPSPFLVTYKAPPTVSISLSAARSQRIPRQQSCGSGAESSEPDLPDVTSVVPFPSTPLASDVDVEMLDATCVPCPDGDMPPPAQVPRKRRSAHSSVTSSPGSLGKDAKSKRAKKSKRQVAELWWLGVVHRSILRGIEARQSAVVLGSGKLQSGLQPFEALDHALVERIQRRLAGNGCVDGRSPSPLPRITSPSISVPSLNLLTPSMRALSSVPVTHSSERTSKEHGSSDRPATTISPGSKARPCTSLSIISYSPMPSSTPTSRRRHVHFEVAQRPRQSRPTILRRSPSPPPRAGSVPPNPQTPTLTIPQLVASLTLTYHERSKQGLRGRACRSLEDGKDAGRPLSSGSCQVTERDDGETIQDDKRMQQSFTARRARLSSTPERKSPLSRVAYAVS